MNHMVITTNYTIQIKTENTHFQFKLGFKVNADITYFK